MTPHDNYYETAVTHFREALSVLSPSGQAVNDPQWFALHGLIRLAQGLEQHQRETEWKINQIQARLSLPR
jgi:hypothetical protein